MPTIFTTTRILLAAALTVSLATATTLRAGQGDAKRGQEVYTAQKCQGCHAIGGKGYKANPLDGVGKKLTSDQIREVKNAGQTNEPATVPEKQVVA